MKVLAVHPGPLMYTKIFLRLEPLGLEYVAEAARRLGHDVQLFDLQVETRAAYEKLIKRWQPDVVAFSCNYLPNIPEVIDLAKLTRGHLPRSVVVVGGHSASFVARELFEHAQGAIDCVLKGEGEAAFSELLQVVGEDRDAVTTVPGVLTRDGEGPAPRILSNLDDVRPARDLVRHRRKYFIGSLDPAASIEFTRGCPWDCSFCSAWTFYGRSYRMVSPERIVEDLARINEPGVFIVDDVAFVQRQHGIAIGEAIARAGIKKKYYLETRGDVLLRNKEVFAFWKSLGLQYIFLGMESIDEDGLLRFRKRISLSKNFEALEYARSLGLKVAINLIADPSWDERRFEVIRQWCQEIPEVVSLTVNTPYPGTETWHQEGQQVQTQDYRLYDIQHAVLPTALPLARFYEELVKTQQVLNRKHLGWAALRGAAKIAAGNLRHGQTNFVKMLWKFNQVYNAKLQLADHSQPLKYAMTLPPAEPAAGNQFIHPPRGGRRALDHNTEQFVEEVRDEAPPSPRPL